MNGLTNKNPFQNVPLIQKYKYLQIFILCIYALIKHAFINTLSIRWKWNLVISKNSSYGWSGRL